MSGFNPSTGAFVAVAGAETAAAGNTITSATWDAFNVAYRVALTQLGQGKFAPVTSTLTLVNGANSDIVLPTTTRMHITGPTGGFSITGFAGGLDGMRIWLFNSTTQAMTLTNEATSTAANRILTLTGSNVVLRSGTSFATLSYDGTSSRWILESSN